MKFSADQHLAIAQHLRRVARTLPPDDPKQSGLRLRARSFLARGKVARDEGWPSCPVGAACSLTHDEAQLFTSADRETWRRVYVPYLTALEIASLRQQAKETSAYFQKAFAHLRSKSGSA
jgi:hypothetical protein